MLNITYVEIENFKGFKNKVRVPLANPSVLIGPNNSGKTTVLQALSLWSRAIREWYTKKGDFSGESQTRYGVGINRLTILDIPVRESRYFWNDTHTREGSKTITFSIEVGVMIDNKEHPTKMIFNSRDQESVYCRPDKNVLKDTKLLKFASGISFNLLYPMSGIASGAMDISSEFLISDGQMNVYLGQGQTSHVLRNLCYRIFKESVNDWEHITHFLSLLFQIKLLPPELDEARSSLTLNYKERSDTPLEIALAGRGMQQVLLILAYLYTHKKSVLMIDEPDAHLEILRQKQIFSILQEASGQTNSQVIIATHSEVILDESVDTNLSFILDGDCRELSKENVIKSTLRSLGVEHYYQAKIMPHLLVVEGSTDISMLRAFARKLAHPALKYLNDRLFTYYTRDVSPKRNIDDTLLRQATPTDSYRNYFFTLKELVPELNGLVLLDSDGKDYSDQNGKTEKDLTTMYWKRYELENYFITPEILIKYVENQTEEEDLFATQTRSQIEQAVDEVLAEMLYDNNLSAVHEYHEAGKETRKKLLSKIKMSLFAEKVFKRFAELQDCSVLLNKGQFYLLIECLEPAEIPSEIVEGLDALQQLFEPVATEK